MATYYCKYCLLERKGPVSFDTIAALNKHIADAHPGKATVSSEATSEATFTTGAPLYDALFKPFGANPRAEAKARAEAWQPKINATYTAAVAAEVAAEVLSAGQVDISIVKFLDVPYMRAWVDSHDAIKRVRLEVAVLTFLRQQYLHEYQPTIPSAGDLVQFNKVGLLTDDHFKEHMKSLGFSDSWAEQYRWSWAEHPDLARTLTLLRRGTIDAAKADFFLMKGGFRKPERDLLLTLRDEIPGAGDLVRMVVREAFDPKMVVAAPDVFATYMLKQGFAKEWSDRYWTAHFEPIELRQAYENLWRGNWTKDQFMYALHIKDIHPAWREDIYNVAFLPPGMRELGYGFDVGVYKREDIVKYRRWGGLSPSDAEKAADSLIAYRTEAEREAVRREHMHRYALGKESMQQFDAALRRLGTAAPAILLWEERAALEKDRLEKEPAMPEQRTVSSSEALQAFSMGIRDEAWTRQRLADLYWTPERIDLAIERAEWQDSAGDEIRKHRGVLEAKLKEGFLKKDEFSQELIGLGFTPAVIAALEEWADEAAEWDDVSEQASAWWSLAKAGKVSSEEYAAEVRKLGMVEERITSKQKLLAKLAEIRMAEAAAKAKA